MKSQKKISKTQKSQRGATVLEYALLTACLAVVVIAAISYSGKKAEETFTNVRDAMATGHTGDTF